MKEELYVVKANQERELYDPEKIKQALLRAKIPLEYHNGIFEHLNKNLYQNIKTVQIHNLINGFLNQIYPLGEIRFSLKKAIMKLGPTGYPFEVFVGHLLAQYGYKTEVALKIKGSCVTHEVDVLAEKINKTYFVECKYHNQPGLRSDVKVVLYVQARGEDLIDRTDKNKQYGVWIFTNTRFSTDAVCYAECKKIRLTGWNYPNKQDNLQAMIEKNNLYPITVLPILTNDQIKKLLQENIFLAKELMERKDLGQKLGFKQADWEKIKQQCSYIFNS